MTEHPRVFTLSLSFILGRDVGKFRADDSMKDLIIVFHWTDTPPLFTPSNTLAFTMPGPQINPATELSTSIEPPTVLHSSPTELGSTFSRVELCSQTSADNVDLSSSNTSGVGKGRIHNTDTGRFQKGVGIKRKTRSHQLSENDHQSASRNPCYFRKSNFLCQTHVSASKFVRKIRYRFAIYWYLMGHRYLHGST